MIFHCSKCGKLVQFDDNYCRFCGEKQNVEANMMKKRREEYRERDERVKKYFHKYENRPFYHLLFDEDGRKHEFLSETLTLDGHKLLVLEMEKDMYATELLHASPSTKEKKQYSYDLRVKRINALIEKLEEKNKNAKFLSIWY
nr:MAG TPA: zinc-ribbon domain protein [Caudoviricetes sp.]